MMGLQQPIRGCSSFGSWPRTDGRSSSVRSIVLHTLSGVSAFVVGVAALQPVRASRHRWLPPLLAGLLVGLVVFMVAAMAIHWTELAGASQILFAALVGLGVYMVHRALHARSLAAHADWRHQERYMDDIGFVLIALFDPLRPSEVVRFVSPTTSGSS